MLRLNAFAALAIVATAVPAAFAQSDMAPPPASNGEARVEVIGTGSAEAQADAVLLVVSYMVEGDTEVAAQAALRVKRGEIVEAATRLGGDGVTATPSESPVTSRFPTMAVASSAAPGSDEAPPVPKETAFETLTLRITQVDRAAAVREAIEQLGVASAAASPEVSDAAAAAAGQQARQRAIAAARANAETYATALGMRVGAVIRVSETGHGIVFPSLQEEVTRMFDSQAMAARAQWVTGRGDASLTPPAVRRSVIVEFALLP